MGAVALVAVLATGCAGPEKKLGRGINNAVEPIRLAEWRRSVEQVQLYDSPSHNRPTGMVRGFNRTVARAGLGLFEIITFPIPSYDPIWTSYLAPNPLYPDSAQVGPTPRADSGLGFNAR
jgi:putative exosortase-associated protein (TIGR04073 family)